MIDDFLTMETWLNDNIAIPGEVYREFVKYLYQQNLLVQNRMPVGKHIVDLRSDPPTRRLSRSTVKGGEAVLRS